MVRVLRCLDEGVGDIEVDRQTKAGQTNLLVGDLNIIAGEDSLAELVDALDSLGTHGVVVVVRRGSDRFGPGCVARHGVGPPSLRQHLVCPRG